MLKLKSQKNIVCFGSNTNGQFAYGFIKSYETPNCKFKFIIPTKKYKNRLQYEFIGLEPDVKLDDIPNKDWLDTVKKYLNTK